MGYYDNGRPTVSRPEGDEDLELWDLLEKGGERVPLLNEAEARAAMLLLQILSSGDGLGHEQAVALAGRLARRLPSED